MHTLIYANQRVFGLPEGHVIYPPSIKEYVQVRWNFMAFKNKANTQRVPLSAFICVS